VSWQYLGKVYLRQRKPKEAIDSLERLGKLVTSNQTYLFDLSNAYQMAGNTQKALEMRRRYAVAEQQGVAIKRFKSRLSSNPRDFDSMLGLGLLLLGSDRPVSAHKYLQAAQKLRPDDLRSQNALRKLESLYVGHLRFVEQGLQKRDIGLASHHLSQAMLLLPQDARTAAALRRLQAATGSAPNTQASSRASQ
jgi:tetratricopeptide (TPR) repeat protein